MLVCFRGNTSPGPGVWPGMVSTLHSRPPRNALWWRYYMQGTRTVCKVSSDHSYRTKPSDVKHPGPMGRDQPAHVQVRCLPPQLLEQPRDCIQFRKPKQCAWHTLNALETDDTNLNLVHREDLGQGQARLTTECLGSTWAVRSKHVYTTISSHVP